MSAVREKSEVIAEARIIDLLERVTIEAEGLQNVQGSRNRFKKAPPLGWTVTDLINTYTETPPKGTTSTEWKKVKSFRQGIELEIIRQERKEAALAEESVIAL